VFHVNTGTALFLYWSLLEYPKLSVVDSTTLKWNMKFYTVDLSIINNGQIVYEMSKAEVFLV
jgi:archaellum component FlaF (FlaF/FlaG flagellin family)